MKDFARSLAIYDAYLGALFHGAPVDDDLTPAMFFDQGSRTIFNTLRKQILEGVRPSGITVIEELEEQKLLDAAGGAGNITRIASSLAMPEKAASFAEKIKSSYRERVLGVNVRESLTAALGDIDAGEDAEKLLPKLKKYVDDALEVCGVKPEAPDTGISFADLMQQQFPDDPPLVEGLIYPGLTVLTGASKIGKSWAALQMVKSLDGGGYYLGTLKAEKCDVLYCALEDTPRRVQRRLLKQGLTDFHGSRLETKRRNSAGIKAFLKEHPNFRVVIIDTLQKMLGIHDLNDYSQTVDGLSALKDIADSMGIAVVVLHHNRKGSNDDGDHMESALGSTGINATADTTLTMRRKRGTGEATLSVTGRDVEDTSFTLAWDGGICSWAVTGQGALAPATSPERQEVIDLLDSDRRVWTTKEVAEAIGKSISATSHTLTRMVEGHEICRHGHGKWLSVKIDILTLPRESQYVNIENDTTEGAA